MLASFAFSGVSIKFTCVDKLDVDVDKHVNRISVQEK